MTGAPRAALSERVRARIRDVPDFPQPGIVFKDITPLLADHELFHDVIETLAERFAGHGVDEVIGIESRGFIFAAPLALRLGSGFIPVRKPGKLPHRTIRMDYDLEYGSDALEVHADAVTPGQRVLIVDDVLATGGTAAATARLLERVGGRIVGMAFVVELAALNGRERLGDRPVLSLMQY